MDQDKNKVLNVQPHSDEAEQAVLGSMLSSAKAVDKAFEKKLKSGHFYKNAHLLIFSAICFSVLEISVLIFFHSVSATAYCSLKKAS